MCKKEKVDLRKLVLSAMQGPPKKDWDYEKQGKSSKNEKRSQK